MTKSTTPVRQQSSVGYMPLVPTKAGIPLLTLQLLHYLSWARKGPHPPREFPNAMLHAVPLWDPHPPSEFSNAWPAQPMLRTVPLWNPHPPSEFLNLCPS